MFLQGRANLNDNQFRDLKKYAWLDQSSVFTGEIETAMFSDYCDSKTGQIAGSKINITLCNDQTMQKAGFSVFVFRKGTQTFSGHVSQLMYHAGIDIDNATGLDMEEIKDKNGNQVKNKKTDTPLYRIPCLRGTAITVMIKRTGEGQDGNGNVVPYYELFGWDIFNANGFSANECKYGDLVEKKYGRGFKFAEVYEKFMTEINSQGVKYGLSPQNQQQPQQAQARGYGEQPQQAQARGYGEQPQQQMPYPNQYGAQPNAQPYRNLPPLPGRPQNMPQQQPTQQQVQQADNGNDPLPF